MHEEDDLVLWLVHLAKTGHPQNKSELLDSVQNIVNENKRTTPFTDKHVLGETWYKNFMRRHPAIVVRVPEFRGSYWDASCCNRRLYLKVVYKHEGVLVYE